MFRHRMHTASPPEKWQKSKQKDSQKSKGIKIQVGDVWQDQDIQRMLDCIGQHLQKLIRSSQSGLAIYVQINGANAELDKCFEFAKLTGEVALKKEQPRLVSPVFGPPMYANGMRIRCTLEPSKADTQDIANILGPRTAETWESSTYEDIEKTRQMTLRSLEDILSSGAISISKTPSSPTFDHLLEIDDSTSFPFERRRLKNDNVAEQPVKRARKSTSPRTRSTEQALTNEPTTSIAMEIPPLELRRSKRKNQTRQMDADTQLTIADKQERQLTTSRIQDTDRDVDMSRFSTQEIIDYMNKDDDKLHDILTGVRNFLERDRVICDTGKIPRR
ncbi:hypothetical protein BJV82DRAFT_620056 [Fennellomyces sp. T-0311]|nr:hypothetical protein BJV82DRAFT_620056 [Fennellomyces sp. T-0311]